MQAATVFPFPAAALAFVTVLAAAGFAQPTLTVSPTTGPPTDKVFVGGTGFAAGEAVDIYFDKSDLSLPAAGSNGAFVGVTLTIPGIGHPRHALDHGRRAAERACRANHV